MRAKINLLLAVGSAMRGAIKAATKARMEVFILIARGGIWCIIYVFG